MLVPPLLLMPITSPTTMDCPPVPDSMLVMPAPTVGACNIKAPCVLMVWLPPAACSLIQVSEPKPPPVITMPAVALTD